MSKFVEKIKKHREFILYLIFGVATTLVNIVAYWALARLLSVGVLISTVLAWLVSVIFAFITSRLFVFEARSGNILWQMATFFASRIFTGVVDTAIMVIFADMLGFNDIIIKILANVVVIVLNFILSKLIVFRKRK